MGQVVEFPANGHRVSGYLAIPPSRGGPGVLVMQEWWGLVDHIKDVCDRLAREGFVALAPLLAHFAKRDNSVKEADAHALVNRIETAGGSVEAHYYDADHAFFNDTRPTVYDPQSARAAWDRTLGFLRAHVI